MLRRLSRTLSQRLMQLTGVVVLGCSLSTTAMALSYGSISQLYFFGDSLTDSGFNDLWSVPAPLPVGKAPTFTTFGGYTWSQYVTRDIKGFTLPVYPGPSPADTITNNSIETVAGFVSGTLNGINYAAAGSTTNSTGNGEVWAPSLHQQVTYFLATHGGKADPSAVYFLWSGANDLLKLLPSTPGAPLPTQLQLLTAASTAAINIGTEVSRLAAAGAKRVVVMSLPNIGLTPLASALAAAGGMPSLPGSLKTITFSFNSMLNTQLGNVINQYHINILYVDVYDLLNNVILKIQAGQPYVIGGQSFQFANYTTPACGSLTTPAIYCTSSAPTNYVFADSIHPTDMAHRLLSLQVEAQIQSW